MTGITVRPPAGFNPPLHRRIRLWHPIAAAAVIVAIVFGAPLLEQPTFIDRITVDNPTRFDITIYVTEDDRDGWMAVGTARREERSTFEEIYDQGPVWIFRFSAQGEIGGQLRLTRHQLEHDRWRLVIPERISEELQAKGAPFPP